MPDAVAGSAPLLASPPPTVHYHTISTQNCFYNPIDAKNISVHVDIMSIGPASYTPTCHIDHNNTAHRCQTECHPTPTAQIHSILGTGQNIFLGGGGGGFSFYFGAKRHFFTKNGGTIKNIIALNLYINTNVLAYERWLVLKVWYTAGWPAQCFRDYIDSHCLYM